MEGGTAPTSATRLLAAVVILSLLVTRSYQRRAPWEPGHNHNPIRTEATAIFLRTKQEKEKGEKPIMTEKAPTSYATDPTLYLYTSLTAGSSHILTATSRLETILKANKIPFRAIDVATDEKARMLWGRRSKGRKLPGLVRYGGIIGVSI